MTAPRPRRVPPLPGSLLRVVTGLVVTLLTVLALATPSLLPARAADASASGTKWSATDARGSAAAPAPRPVVVIGLAGLSAQDLSPRSTPVLWALAGDAAVGSLVVRSVHLSTCPVDGWLTLGAGGRAAQPGDGDAPPCQALPQPPAGGPTSGPTTVPGWAEYVTAAMSTRQSTRLGSLSAALSTGGACVTAVGPGAGLAAADPQGQVRRWVPYDAGTLRDELARCPVTLVDPGQVRADTGARTPQVNALDGRVGEVLAAAGPDATVIAAALADDGPVARVRPLVVREHDARAGVTVGVVSSGSTRQHGWSLLTDLAPTITDLVGTGEDGAWSGHPLSLTRTTTPVDHRVEALQDHAEAAQAVADVAMGFWVTWALAQLAACLVAWLGRRRGRCASWLSPVLVVAACVPAASYLAGLVPWWRSPLPTPTLWVAVYGVALVLGAVALLGPWRRHPFGPPAAVAGLTTLVIAGDALTGSHLVLSTLLGEQPTIGGRFYGLGNVAFSLLATSVLLLMVGLATRDRAGTSPTVPLDDEPRGPRPGRGTVAAVLLGLAAVAIDGAPMWGADLGGPIALLPAVAFLGLVLLGVRLTWRRVLVVGAVTAAVVAALALADYLRPAGSRTHLGRFVQTLVDGGAADVLVRKAVQNLQILLTAPFAFLVPIGLVVAVWALARPASVAGRALAPALEAVPLLRPGLLAVLVMWLIGFATNDSGTAIPAVGATILLPLLVATAVGLTPGRAAPARRLEPPAGETRR